MKKKLNYRIVSMILAFSLVCTSMPQPAHAGLGEGPYKPDNVGQIFMATAMYFVRSVIWTLASDVANTALQYWRSYTFGNGSTRSSSSSASASPSSSPTLVPAQSPPSPLNLSSNPLTSHLSSGTMPIMPQQPIVEAPIQSPPPNAPQQPVEPLSRDAQEAERLIRASQRHIEHPSVRAVLAQLAQVTDALDNPPTAESTEPLQEPIRTRGRQAPTTPHGSRVRSVVFADGTSLPGFKLTPNSVRDIGGQGSRTVRRMNGGTGNAGREWQNVVYVASTQRLQVPILDLNNQVTPMEEIQQGVQPALDQIQPFVFRYSGQTKAGKSGKQTIGKRFASHGRCVNSNKGRRFPKGVGKAVRNGSIVYMQVIAANVHPSQINALEAWAIERFDGTGEVGWNSVCPSGKTRTTRSIDFSSTNSSGSSSSSSESASDSSDGYTSEEEEEIEIQDDDMEDEGFFVPNDDEERPKRKKDDDDEGSAGGGGGRSSTLTPVLQALSVQ